MTKLKNPLFSLTAQKQLGHELIYKMKGNRAFVTKYNRPGNKNPFSPSASQVTNREFYTSAVAIWQAKTQDQKDYWNELAKEKNLSMSGWNLFYQTAFNSPLDTLGYSIFGERLHGFYQNGYEPLS